MILTIDQQKKALRMAERDAKRMLVKAREINNQEWIEDQEFIIQGIESALETLDSLNKFKDVLQKIG